MADLQERLDAATAAESGTVPLETRLARAAQAEETPVRASDLGRFGRMMDDLARSVAQGATFNFADEFAAFMSDLTGVGGQAPEAQGYEERLAAERARDVQIPSEVAIPGQIAGAVGAGLAAAPLAAARGAMAAPSLARIAGRGAVAGAAGGGLAGAGAAEGGLTERASGAATGAGLGALTGGVAGPATAVVARLAGRLRARLTQPGMTAAKRRALQKVATALEAEEITPEMAQARLRRMGEEGVLADIGTEAGPLQGLARAAGQAPGPGRTIAQRNLLGRTRRQTRRVRGLIRRLVSGEKAADVSEGVINQRSAAAGPAYDRAFAAQPQGGLASSDIQRLLQNPTVKSAIARWRRIDPRAEGVADNNLEALDQAYKFIGGQAQAVRRSGDNVRANSMNELRAQLRQAIVEEVPEYADALDAFSSRAALLDALEEGRQILNRPPSEISRFIANLDEGEREMFQVGIADALTDRLSRVTEQGDVTKRLFGNDRIREQIRAAFPDRQTFRDFTRGMIREARMARTARIATPSAGSQTAPRLVEESELSRSPLIQDIRQGVMFGAPSALTTRAVRTADDIMNRLTAGPEQVRAELARLLMQPGASQGRQIIDEVMQRRLVDALSRRAATAGGVAGGALAGQAAPPINAFVGERVR